MDRRLSAMRNETFCWVRRIVVGVSSATMIAIVTSDRRTHKAYARHVNAVQLYNIYYELSILRFYYIFNDL